MYPWNGHFARTDDKKYYGSFVGNLRRGRGDYMGVAGNLNDVADYTNPVIYYWPNDYGLYNMAGNVAEWVMDIYRQLSLDDMADLNPFRGNYYETPKLMDDGTVDDRIEDGDKVGQVPMVPVSDFKNDRRRNYRAADNKNFLDGDWASTYGAGSTETWQKKDNTKATKQMYDKTAYPTGTYSLVDDNTRFIRRILERYAILVQSGQ